MKKALFVAALAGLYSSAQAEPVTLIGGGIAQIAPAMVGFLIGQNTSAPACASEPVRRAAWKSNPSGYSFVVTGCDYQAKADRLVLVK